MNAALEFELLKARRAGVFRWGAIVVAVGVPALSIAFFELVRLGGDSPSAAKAATMITDLTLAGLLGTAGQVLSVAILMTVGIAASWSFGREFVDDALPALFAIATPRSTVAAAKLVVLPGWALLTVISTVILICRAIAVDGHGRRSRGQRGVSDPAAVTAPGCGHCRRRDAQLVAACRGELTLTVLDGDHAGLTALCRDLRAPKSVLGRSDGVEQVR
jgi:ABC-2 type transport system permease protein